MKPIISNTNIKKLQTIQNTALNLLLAAHEIQTLNTYTMKPRFFNRHHLKLNATKLKQLIQTQTHPLHDFT